MSYSVNKITTVADCDLLLAWAAKEKADLEFKKNSINESNNFANFYNQLILFYNSFTLLSMA